MRTSMIRAARQRRATTNLSAARCRKRARQSLFAELADRSLQRSGGEGPGAGLATDRQDYLDKLKQEHRDYLAGLGRIGTSISTRQRKRERGSRAAARCQMRSHKRVLPAEKDTVPQERLLETAEESEPPIAGETPSASEEISFKRGRLRAEQLD